MNYFIDIQHACDEKIPVSDAMLRDWAELSLKPYKDTAELTIRLVTPDEIRHLNLTYRQQDKATNVLAFPSSYPKEISLDYPLLGDIIICPDVLKNESTELKTPLIAHWAHIVIHGILHLLGYDHIKDEDAHIMQAIEIKCLAELGYPNPYKETD